MSFVNFFDLKPILPGSGIAYYCVEYLCKLCTICMEHLFLYFHFQPVGVSGSQLTLINIILLDPISLTHSVNFWLLIRESSLFTCKTITDEERIVIVLFVFCVLYSFFVSHFLHCHLLLCLVDSEMFKFFFRFLLGMLYGYFLCGYQGNYIKYLTMCWIYPRLTWIAYKKSIPILLLSISFQLLPS